MQPSGQPPVIVSFTSDVLSLKNGTSTFLRWNVGDPRAIVKIDTDDVPTIGTKIVAPTFTTEYVLIARNDNGTTKSSVRVNVVP